MIGFCLRALITSLCFIVDTDRLRYSTLIMYISTHRSWQDAWERRGRGAWVTTIFLFDFITKCSKETKRMQMATASRKTNHKSNTQWKRSRALRSADKSSTSFMIAAIIKNPFQIIAPWLYAIIINLLTPKISLVILLPVCHTALVMLVWRNWYWIN